VLFNHACVVEPYELPKGTKIVVDMGWVSEDDYDDSITIFETVPNEDREKEQQDKVFETTGFGIIGVPEFFEDDTEAVSHQGDPTLRLDLDSVSVQEIKGVSYTTATRSVSRHRSTKDEEQTF